MSSFPILPLPEGGFQLSPTQQRQLLVIYSGAGRGSGEERALVWEAEALDPSPVFSFNKHCDLGQVLTPSGLPFHYPYHETTFLFYLTVHSEE